MPTLLPSVIVGKYLYIFLSFKFLTLLVTVLFAAMYWLLSFFPAFFRFLKMTFLNYSIGIIFLAALRVIDLLDNLSAFELSSQEIVSHHSTFY